MLKVSKRFFQVINLFFQKKPNSESFENSRAVNTLVHILDEISHVQCFWIFSRKFCQHSILFCRKKNKFWTCWDLLRKNTIGDAICKRFAKVSDFWKIKFFYEGKHYFSKNLKFWTFWDCISKKNFWKPF